MYPGDDDKEQQPANRNLMGEAPQPFSYQDPLQQDLGQPQQPQRMQSPQPRQQPGKRGNNQDDKSPILKFLPWIISGVVVLIILIVAIVLIIVAATKDNKKDDKTGTNNTNDTQQSTGTDTGASECSTKLRRYQNEDLDIRFCYPVAWGDVKVSDGKQDPSDNGTRIRISFADKTQVHLGLVSDDWSTSVGKGSTCTDPSAQAFPDTNAFSAKWVTEGTPVSSAIRGLEVVPDQYLLQERTDSTNTAGVCLEGYQAFGGDVYRNAEITYYSQFSTKVATPQAHIGNPTALVPVADRNDLTTVVKSIEKF